MLPTTTQRALSWLATYYCNDLSSFGIESSIFVIDALQKLIY